MEEHGPALRGEIADLRERVAKRRGEESWAIRNRGPRRYGKAPPPMPPTDAFPPALVPNPGWFASIFSEETPEVGLGAALVGQPEM